MRRSSFTQTVVVALYDALHYEVAGLRLSARERRTEAQEDDGKKQTTDARPVE